MQGRLWEVEGELNLQDASIVIHRQYFSPLIASAYLKRLKSVSWKQEELIVFGKKHLEPRETAWYGDKEASYTYSGLTHKPKPWIPVLDEIRNDVTAIARASFNSVLANRCRDGQDGVAWHADDEFELGENPVIGSVSFGQTRRFQLRHKYEPRAVVSLDLHHGDLMVMSGGTQKFWEHQIPKTKQSITERINLTFRNINHG